MTLRCLSNAILTALVAPPCAICQRVLDCPLDGAVCGECWCAVAVQPSAFSLRSIVRARTIGDYDGRLRDLIHALKYDGRRSIAAPLAALMREHGEALLRDANFVVPVPLHSRRLRERGFNQALDLARGLSVPVAEMLVRVRATASQVHLPAAERRQNVRGAFIARRPRWRVPWLSPVHRTPLSECIVVLVDDVATTGATLEACASALRALEVKEVRALTAARVATALRQTPRA